MTTGLKIKKAREALGITQLELANRLRVSRATIAMYETGKALPRTGDLLNLSEILYCTVDELLSTEQKERRSIMKDQEYSIEREIEDLITALKITHKVQEGFKKFDDPKDMLSAMKGLLQIQKCLYKNKDSEDASSQGFKIKTQGIASFGGPKGSRVIVRGKTTFGNYTVHIQPVENPCGELGEVWVSEQSINSFLVHNSGNANTAFRYTVIEFE